MNILSIWFLVVIILTSLKPVYGACNPVIFMEMKRDLKTRQAHVGNPELLEIESELEKLLSTLGNDQPETKFHFWQHVKRLEKFQSSFIPDMSQHNRYFLEDFLELTNRRHLVSYFVEGLRNSEFIENPTILTRQVNYILHRDQIQIPSAEHIGGIELGVIGRSILSMLQSLSPSTRELRYAFWRQACEITGVVIPQPDLDLDTTHFVFEVTNQVNAMQLMKTWIEGIKDRSPLYLRIF